MDKNGSVLTKEGVYLLDLSSNPAKCTLLQSMSRSSPSHVVRAPAAVGIARTNSFAGADKNYVVAAGQYGSGWSTYPAVYRAEIDLTSASTAAKTLNWTITGYLSPTDTKPSSL
ncbi:MAG: hypothetical protein HYV60_23525, partial [Planctomycetia bacterium]|nr:hypothetical protein [Planctomycetia bacterium]